MLSIFNFNLRLLNDYGCLFHFLFISFSLIFSISKNAMFITLYHVHMFLRVFSFTRSTNFNFFVFSISDFPATEIAEIGHKSSYMFSEFTAWAGKLYLFLTEVNFDKMLTASEFIAFVAKIEIVDRTRFFTDKAQTILYCVICLFSLARLAWIALTVVQCAAKS